MPVALTVLLPPFGATVLLPDTLKTPPTVPGMRSTFVPVKVAGAGPVWTT